MSLSTLEPADSVLHENGLELRVTEVDCGVLLGRKARFELGVATTAMLVLTAAALTAASR